MLSEDKVVIYTDDVVLVMFVVVVQVLEDSQLNSCLILKFLFVSDDFKSYLLVSFVIEAFDGLSKTSLTQEF